MDIFDLLLPEICYATGTDPWVDMTDTVIEQMPDLIVFVQTPLTLIISVLCICLVIGVIIKSVHK